MAGSSTMCSTGAVVCKAVRQCPSSAGISMRLLPGVGFRLRNSLRPRYLVTTPALRSAVVQAQYPGDGGGPGVDGYVSQAPPAPAYQQQPFQQQQPPFQQQQQPFQLQQQPFQQQQQPFQQQQQPFQQQQQPFQQQQEQQQQQPGNPSAGGQVDPNAEQLWRSLFSNPSQFWDDRSKKRFPSDPDFVKKGTRDKLWIESPTTPPWVQGQLSQLPAPVARPPRQFGNQGGYGNQGQGYQQGGGGGGGGQWANRQGDPNAPQENRPRPRYRETYRPQPKLTPEEEAAREERIRQILSHNPPEHRRLFTHKYFPDPFTGEYDPPDS